MYIGRRAYRGQSLENQALKGRGNPWITFSHAALDVHNVHKVHPSTPCAAIARNPLRMCRTQRHLRASRDRKTAKSAAPRAPLETPWTKTGRNLAEEGSLVYTAS